MPGFLVGLLIQTAIQIGLNLLSRLLEPKRKRPKPQAFQSPTASSGTPMGKGFGIFEIQPVIGLVHEPALIQDKHGDLDVTRYFAKMLLFGGWGPISILYDIISDERSIRTQRSGKLQSDEGLDPNTIYPALPFDFDANPNAGVEFSINVRQIYGGGGEEGGLQGLLMFRPGYTDQPIDPLMQEIDGELASRYPWGVYARLGAETGRPAGLSAAGGNQQGDKFYLVCNTPTPKPISFLCGAYPTTLIGGTGRIGLSANPAEVLYEIYTDRKWGGRRPTSRFNTVQWAAKATQLKNENRGISIPQDDPRSLDDIVEDILSHIDGGIVENPVTGLLELKLARDDYDLNDLLTITKSNARNFRRGKPLPPRTLNDIQVKYRRSHGGMAGTIANEIATENLDWNFWAVGYDEAIEAGSLLAYVYKSAGDNLVLGQNFAFANDVPLVQGVDFNVNAERGTWIFFNTALIDEGMEIRVQYVANPTFVAFVDEVATSQNLANSQRVGRQQAESYDYTFYIDPINAQWKVDRLRATMSRSLDTYSWEGSRDQSHLTPWDVVTILEPEWGISVPTAVRITKVSYGTPWAPRLTIEAVKDLWGEELLLRSIGDTPPIGYPRPTAPAMAIGCGLGGEGVSRIDLFPTEPFYAVEVWEADDEVGSNAILISTITAGTDPMFYDGTVGKFYAARQIGNNSNPGPFTSWITCAETPDPPVDPTCTLPTYSVVPDDVVGMITVEVFDSQSRVQLFEFRHRSGNGPWSEWEITAAPYCHSVTLVGLQDSRIEWRVTYISCDGSTATLIDGYDFIAEIPVSEPPPTVGIQRLTHEIILFEGSSIPMEFDSVPAGPVPISPWRGFEDKFPLNGIVTARLEANILQSSLLAGAYIAVEFEDALLPGAWNYMDGVSGPRIPIDEASLLPLDPAAENAGQLPVVVTGDAITLRDEAKSDVRFRVVYGGGDGDAAKSFIPVRIALQLDVSSLDEEIPDEITDPPVVDPGSCDVPTPVDMSAGTPDDTGGAATAWVLTSTTGELTVTPPASGHSKFAHTFTGLTPNKQHTFYLTIPSGINGEPFLHVIGGDEAVATSSGELLARGDSNGAGELTVEWGANDVSLGGGGGGLNIDTENYQSVGDITADGWVYSETGGTFTTVSIDTAVKDSGVSSIRFLHVHPAWTSSTAMFSKTFGGFTPNAAIVAQVRFRADRRPWFAVPIFRTGVTAIGYEDGPWQTNGTWDTLTNSGGNVDSNGDILVQFGIKSGAGVNENFEYHFDGVMEITVEGEGTFEVDFADLGFCIGSGKGTGNTGIGPGGDEPDPIPPPGGWPPPTVGGSRAFGAHNTAITGTGHFRSTVVTIQPHSAENVFDAAAAAGTKIMFKFWRDEDAVVGGRFSYDRYRSAFDAIANNTLARDAIEAHTGEAAYVHYVIDEPYHPTRFGPGGISLSTVEAMCRHSKDAFPNLATVIRVHPTIFWMTRHIDGLDWLWAEYHLLRGPAGAFLTDQLARCDVLNHDLVVGIHYYDFAGPPSDRRVTPAELRTHGMILARNTSLRIKAMGGWQYRSEMDYLDWWNALKEVRDEFNSHDPP